MLHIPLQSSDRFDNLPHCRSPRIRKWIFLYATDDVFPLFLTLNYWFQLLVE